MSIYCDFDGDETRKFAVSRSLTFVKLAKHHVTQIKTFSSHRPVILKPNNERFGQFQRQIYRLVFFASSNRCCCCWTKKGDHGFDDTAISIFNQKKKLNKLQLVLLSRRTKAETCSASVALEYRTKFCLKMLLAETLMRRFGDSLWTWFLRNSQKKKLAATTKHKKKSRWRKFDEARLLTIVIQPSFVSS